MLGLVCAASVEMTARGMGAGAGARVGRNARRKPRAWATGDTQIADSNASAQKIIECVTADVVGESPNLQIYEAPTRKGEVLVSLKFRKLPLRLNQKFRELPLRLNQKIPI